MLRVPLLLWLAVAATVAPSPASDDPAGADEAQCAQPPKPTTTLHHPRGEGDGGGWRDIAVEDASTLPFDEFVRSYVDTGTPVILRDDRVGGRFGDDDSSSLSSWSTSRLLAECGDGEGEVLRPSSTSLEWGAFEGGDFGGRRASLRDFVEARTASASKCREETTTRRETSTSTSTCGEYLFDYSVRCSCPTLLDAPDVVPPLRLFGGDVLPFALPEESPWPVLIVGAAGSRSQLHVDNAFLPFWLKVLTGEKTFRVIRLHDWQTRLATSDGGRRVAPSPPSPPPPPLFTPDGDLLSPVDVFDDAYVDRELIGRRGATVYDAVLRPGDVVYVPVGALHGGYNRFPTALVAGDEKEQVATDVVGDVALTIALTGNFLDDVHAPLVRREFCDRFGDYSEDDAVCHLVGRTQRGDGPSWPQRPAEEEDDDLSFSDWLFRDRGAACHPNLLRQAECSALRRQCTDVPI